MSQEYFYNHYINQPLIHEIAGRLNRKAEYLEKRRAAGDMLLPESTKRFWYHLIHLEKPELCPCDYDHEAVGIGQPGGLSPSQADILHKTLLDLRPWRKGPFRYFDTTIDAEWDSHLKWQRVMKLMKPPLENARVADIGCNNSYYMYKMLAHKPRLVIGLDPMERYYYHFYLNQLYAQAPNLAFDLLGADDLYLYQGFFDIVFFMGVLYHRKNPLQTLEAVHESLKPDGLILFEGAGIDGKGSYCYFPESRYMKAKGYWFLPSAEAAANMLKRSGFYDIKIHGSYKTDENEQRRTPWVNTETLEDFLDPDNPELTVEGAPAPYRHFISARKRKA